MLIVRVWTDKARARLKRGLLSRAEYTKALRLCDELSVEIRAVYDVIADEADGRKDMAVDRIKEAMRRAGVA